VIFGRLGVILARAAREFSRILMFWHPKSPKSLPRKAMPRGCAHTRPPTGLVWGLNQGIRGTFVVRGWLGQLWQQYVPLIGTALVPFELRLRRTWIYALKLMHTMVDAPGSMCMGHRP
jgi:hypothetical protein